MQIALVQKRKYHQGKKENGLAKLCSTKLALELEADILTPKISPDKEYDLIINWGCSNIPWLESNFDLYNDNTLNLPIDIIKSINKLTSFHFFNVYCVKAVPYTNNMEGAKLWFEQNPECKVFCRTITNGSKGDGIIISSSKEELVEAPLYTLFMDTKYEFRCHVIKDKVIKIQQKKRLSKEKLEERKIYNSNPMIRNSSNGYIFSTKLAEEIDNNTIDALNNQAILAIQSLSLDFGAVDIIVTKDKEVMVLEVNTAPGIEGSTVSAYVEAFKELSN